MCTPQIVSEALATLTRRDLINGALGAVVAAQVKESPRAAVKRTLPLTNLLDLTHPLTPEFPFIPVGDLTFPFGIEPVATVEKNGVYANKWTLIEHIGTHIDAPSHFIPGKPNLDNMKPHDLFVPIAVLDIRDKAKRDRDYAITVDDIHDYEKKQGKIPVGAGVFMLSGWAEKAGDPKEFIGTDSSGTLHFPGFSPEVCTYLATERHIGGVGGDTISFDIGPDKEYKAHKALFTYGKWAVENIAHLDQVPPKGATAIMGALKVPKASGGPLRLLAAWE